MATISGLQPDVRERARVALERARQAGLRVTVTSGYRSMREQKRLYDRWIARGRTGLPAARPGSSTHNFGLAFDAVVAGGRLPEFVRIAECAGLKWAGRRDPVHFDPFGFEAWAELVRQGKLPPVGYSC